MAEIIKLSPDNLKELHEVDERLMSFNVEMTEVLSGKPTHRSRSSERSSFRR